MNNQHDLLSDYNPADVPIIYPEDNIDPISLEEKLAREREEERLRIAQEEEIKRQHQATLDQQNNLDEAAREREQQRLYEEEKERERQRLEQEQLQNRFGGPDAHSTPPAPDYLTTTSTVRPTKRRTNKPQDRICKLPVDPELDADEEVGYRFGVTGDSRIEFTDLKENLKKSYEFTFHFTTSEPDGVLFYAADARHTDYIALYMINGTVRILTLPPAKDFLTFKLPLSAHSFVQFGLRIGENVVETSVQRQQVERRYL